MRGHEPTIMNKKTIDGMTIYTTPVKKLKVRSFSDTNVIIAKCDTCLDSHIVVGNNGDEKPCPECCAMCSYDEIIDIIHE